MDTNKQKKKTKKQKQNLDTDYTDEHRLNKSKKW